MDSLLSTGKDLFHKAEKTIKGKLDGGHGSSAGSGGYVAGSGGYATGSGGYAAGSGGYSTESGGFAAGSGGGYTAGSPAPEVMVSRSLFISFSL